MSESRKDRRRRLVKWLRKLDRDQMMQMALKIVEELIETKQVHFYSDALAPYWDASGEPLVAGQKTYPDED